MHQVYGFSVRLILGCAVVGLIGTSDSLAGNTEATDKAVSTVIEQQAIIETTVVENNPSEADGAEQDSQLLSIEQSAPAVPAPLGEYGDEILNLLYVN
jgi:hypothetical protein